MNYETQIKQEIRKLITRRYFFKECGVGLGAMALGSLLKSTNAFGEAFSYNMSPQLAEMMQNWEPR